MLLFIQAMQIEFYDLKFQFIVLDCCLGKKKKYFFCIFSSLDFSLTDEDFIDLELVMKFHSLSWSGVGFLRMQTWPIKPENRLLSEQQLCVCHSKTFS